MALRGSGKRRRAYGPRSFGGCFLGCLKLTSGDLKNRNSNQHRDEKTTMIRSRHLSPMGGASNARSKWQIPATGFAASAEGSCPRRSQRRLLAPV